MWQAYVKSTGEYIYPECKILDENTMRFTFDEPYGTGAVRVLITTGISSRLDMSDIIVFGNTTDTSYVLTHDLQSTNFIYELYIDQGEDAGMAVEADVRAIDNTHVGVYLTHPPGINGLKLVLSRASVVIE